MTTTITDRKPELRRVQHAAVRVCFLTGWKVPGYARRCKVETVDHADDVAVLARARAAENAVSPLAWLGGASDGGGCRGDGARMGG